MIRIEFNSAAVLEALGRARAGLADGTRLYTQIGEELVESTRARFQPGIAPDGTRWRDKSPVTLAEYVRRGHGNRPRPLIGASERLSREVLSFPGRDRVEVGSAQPYSAVMQFGAAKGAFGVNRAGRPIPWGTIPARPWLGLSPADEAAIIATVDEFLDESIG